MVIVFQDANLRRRYLDFTEHCFLTYGSTFATEAMLAAYTEGESWIMAARQYVAQNMYELGMVGNAKKSYYMFLSNTGLFFGTLELGIVPMPVEATYLAWLDCSNLMQVVLMFVDIQ